MQTGWSIVATGWSEWYVNGPAGLEQGFTIPIRPDGPGSERLVIALAGSGLEPVAGEEEVLSLVRPDGSEAFRYGGLAAWDADSKALPVQMILSGRQVLLKVDDRDARYPVTVDPVFQSTRLTSDDGAASDEFGNSVALSSDGTTALVGARGKSVGTNTRQGAVYVFTRTGAVWSQQARLILSDGAAGEGFGFSVALSSDGSTALIGTYGRDVPSGPATLKEGAAYVYTRSGQTWSQQARLPHSSLQDAFGWSVAVSGDGNTALVGAASTNGTQVGLYHGAAYIFTRSGQTWNQQSVLMDPDPVAQEWFGWSVVLSSDGATALIGAPSFGDPFLGINSGPGATHVFTRTGVTWNWQSRLTASDGVVGDSFGYYVSLAADGNTSLIGAPYKTIGANTGQGASYAFIRTGVTWSQQARLIANDGAVSDGFGSPALSADGNTALIGTSGKFYTYTRSGTIWTQQSRTDIVLGGPVTISADGATSLVGARTTTIGTNSLQGAAYVFTRSGNNWNQQAQLTSNDGAASDGFGNSVAISADGSTILVGAFGKAVGTNTRQGAVYIFTRSGAVWSQQARLTASDGVSNDNFGSMVALSADGYNRSDWANRKTIGINFNQGAAYIFTRNGSTWIQHSRLTASDGATDDNFGASVVLSGSGTTALIGAPGKQVGVNSGQGAAYVFTHSGDTWDQQSWLTASDGEAMDSFGMSVSLSSDGTIVLVGADTKNIGANVRQGAAYIFTRIDAAWSQHSRLIASDGAGNDSFGRYVSLSSDGTTALIGAHGARIGMNAFQGAAYVFTRSGLAWSQQSKLAASDGASYDAFGWRVALSGDGSTALIGAQNKDNKGAAYAYVRTGATWTQLPRLSASDGAMFDLFGCAVAISGDGSTVLVGAANKDIGANIDQGAAYVIDILFQLTVTVPSPGAGIGSGQVTGTAGGVNCASGMQGICSAIYHPGTTLSLTASTTTNGSTFTGWSQDCSGVAPCLLAMTIDRSVTAGFGLGPGGNGPKAKIMETGYDSVEVAYNAAGSGATIKAVSGNHLIGSMEMNLGKDVILKGGYDALFQTSGLPTVLQGSLAIKSGSLKVLDVRIIPAQ